MSAQATGFVWEHSPYRGAVLLVHLAIADVANDLHENQFWMSVRTLATKARCNRLTARNALARLVRDGFLEQIEPHTDRAPGIFRFRFAGGVSEQPPGGQPVTPPGGQSVTPIPSRDPKKNPTRVEATRFPVDFTLTAPRREFAEKGGLDPVLTFGHFRDHHTAKGTRMMDWDAAWRTWCRRAYEFERQRA